MKTKKYPYGILSKERDNNIVYAEYPQNLVVDLTIAMELVVNRLEFTENEKHYIIIDISNVKQVTAEARTYMQNTSTGLKNILGAAFIASNHVSALLANIFAKTPNITSKYFTNQQDAVLWINELKQKDNSLSKGKF